MTEIDYKKATELDPLNIDADLFYLPEYNERANVLMIRRLGEKAVGNFRKTS